MKPIDGDNAHQDSDTFHSLCRSIQRTSYQVVSLAVRVVYQIDHPLSLDTIVLSMIAMMAIMDLSRRAMMVLMLMTVQVTIQHFFYGKLGVQMLLYWLYFAEVLLRKKR